MNVIRNINDFVNKNKNFLTKITHFLNIYKALFPDDKDQLINEEKSRPKPDKKYYGESDIDYRFRIYGFIAFDRTRELGFNYKETYDRFIDSQ